MNGGMIIVEKARGTVRFFSPDGREVLTRMTGLEVPIDKLFSGLTLEDAVADARLAGNIQIADILMSLDQPQKVKYTGQYGCLCVSGDDDSVSVIIELGLNQEAFIPQVRMPGVRYRNIRSR